MSYSQVFFRSGLLVLAVLFFIPFVSAWTFSNWNGPSSQTPLQPGTPVSASYSMSFSSFDTGTTFDSDDSLVMYTDLANPQWVVTMTETLNDEPVTSQLANRQAAQVRLDSWSLSFSRKEFTVNVKLTGNVPLLNESQEIIILRMQELDPEAKTVFGTLTKKTAQVMVPTPEPTVVPTTLMEEILEITPEPTTMVTTSVPARKQTYTPGPDPLLICGMLAGLVLIAGMFRHRK